MDIEELRKKLRLCKPALASKDFIPVFTDFCFTGETVFAYNDQVAIETPLQTPFKGGVKGTLMLGLLESTDEKEVEFSEKENQLHMHVGNNEWELPITPKDDFLFRWPDEEPKNLVEIDQDWIEGFTKCLIGASNDTTRPEAMGVTVRFDEGVTMYSTDGYTVTRVQVKDDAQEVDFDYIIVPSAFVKIMLDLFDEFGKAKSQVALHDNSIIIDFDGKCWFYSKMIDAEAPLDFEKVIRKFTQGDENSDFVSLPKQFESALNRASIVLEPDPSGKCFLEVGGDLLYIMTDSSYGDLDDQIELDAEHEEIKVQVDPNLYTRVLDLAERLKIKQQCVVLKNETGFLHLISNLQSDD